MNRSSAMSAPGSSSQIPSKRELDEFENVREGELKVTFGVSSSSFAMKQLLASSLMMMRHPSQSIQHCRLFGLEGKVAVITGGASGIGESIVRLFSVQGAKVCIADIWDERGRALCNSLGEGQHVSFVHCDVTLEEDVQHAVDFAVDKYGTIDIMVNNAGVAGSKVSDIRNVSLDEFKRVFDVNVNGVFLGMKHASRVMIPRRKGSIISLASVASVLGGFGPHGYTSSKHAVLGLTKSAAAELGRHGIRVNCVSPYAVPTTLAMAHLPEDQRTEDGLKGFLSFAGSNANLKGVDLMPGDVAQAVLYLATDESGYISGLNLTVDGGVTCVHTSLRQFE